MRFSEICIDLAHCAGSHPYRGRLAADSLNKVLHGDKRAYGTTTGPPEVATVLLVHEATSEHQCTILGLLKLFAIQETYSAYIGASNKFKTLRTQRRGGLQSHTLLDSAFLISLTPKTLTLIPRATCFEQQRARLVRSLPRKCCEHEIGRHH